MLIDTKTFYTKGRLIALLQEGLGTGISVDFNDIDEVCVFTQNIDADEPTLSTLTGVYRFPAHFIMLGTGDEEVDYVMIDTKKTLRASCSASVPSCVCRPGGTECEGCYL